MTRNIRDPEPSGLAGARAADAEHRSNMVALFRFVDDPHTATRG